MPIKGSIRRSASSGRKVSAGRRTSAVGTSRRKRRSAEELRDRLTDAAEEEFRRSGFAGATTAAIARRAETTEAQLFRYFGSKADLFREAIFKPLNRHFQDFISRQVNDANSHEGDRAKSKRYIAELQRFLDSHSSMLISVVVAQMYTPATPHGVAEIDSVRSYFDIGTGLLAARKGRKSKVPPRLLSRVSFAAVLACVVFKDWLFPKGLATDAEIAAAITDFVSDGTNIDLD
jgi:AcrR family transcriptional regulator